MESRNGEVPSPLQVVTNINEASLRFRLVLVNGKG
jgi:hypothetical protein